MLSEHAMKTASKFGLFETKEQRKIRLERESEWNRTHSQGRNELCNCGSGKKFKKCCGK